MKWQDAIAMSKVGKARRNDEQYPLWWRILANGNGMLYDDHILTDIELDAWDRDRWDDWEPEEPKDVIEELGRLVE